MANVYSLRLDIELRERLKKASDILGLSVSETMRHCLRGGCDIVLDENFISVEVDEEMFNQIERALSPGAKIGMTDSFWPDAPGAPTEKEVLAGMKTRRIKEFFKEPEKK